MAAQRPPVPDTGGVDIGTIGQLGSRGHIIGFHGVGTALTSSTPALIALHMRRKASKDHNDQPVPTNVGSDQGRPVDWMPKL